MRERIGRVPGVDLGELRPVESDGRQQLVVRLSIAGRTLDQGTQSSWNRIGPDYFETVGTRVLRGRTIEERDGPGSRPRGGRQRRVRQALLRRADPIGATVGIGGPDRGGDFEIVGLVEDVKYTNPNRPVRPMMFLSAFQAPDYADPSMRNVMLAR